MGSCVAVCPHAGHLIWTHMAADLATHLTLPLMAALWYSGPRALLTARVNREGHVAMQCLPC